MERIITIQTRLELSAKLKRYLSDYIKFYNLIERRVFQDLKHDVVRKEYNSMSRYITHICTEYGILKRTANSIRYDMQGRINAYRELKNTEIQCIKEKIFCLKKKIQKLKQSVSKLKKLAVENLLSEKQRLQYANDRKSLYWKQNKLNQLNQKLEQMIKDKKDGIVSLCFGSKQQFKKQYYLEENGYHSHEKWKHDFQKQRDCGLFFLGSSDEAYGNQLLQLRFDEKADRFTMYLMKDKSYRISNRFCEKQIDLTGVRFKYGQNWLKSAIEQKQSITYRICRKEQKWYLMACFTIDISVRTVSTNGVIGIDYNDGFMSVCETNESGNLIGLEHMPLKFHGTGNRADSEMKEIIAGMVKQADKKCKSIVIEELDFKKTKAKRIKGGSGQGKSYNRMLHLFDYHRYKTALQNACIRNGVELIRINPANTSKIGKEKYMDRKKLTVHQAASYVIARIGQGFIERLEMA